MIDPRQLTELVIRPVLERLGLASRAAEQLLLGTACQESQCGRYLHQLGNGPAVGIFQMEPATHSDIWENFLAGRKPLAWQVGWYLAPDRLPNARIMIHNLGYAAAMCRVHYYRRPEPLPPAGDIEAQARYWKKWYNTPQGRGTVEEYLANWRRYSGS